MTPPEAHQLAVEAALEIGAGVYILHFDRGVSHARHYVGYSDNILQRLEDHLGRRDRGSPLVREAVRRGIGVHLATVYAGDRKLERKIKDGKNVARHCPICRGDAMRRNAAWMARHRSRIVLLARATEWLRQRDAERRAAAETGNAAERAS